VVRAPHREKTQQASAPAAPAPGPAPTAAAINLNDPMPLKAAEQGFEGKPVQHVNQSTMTGDWRREFGPKGPLPYPGHDGHESHDAAPPPPASNAQDHSSPPKQEHPPPPPAAAQKDQKDDSHLKGTGFRLKLGSLALSAVAAAWM